MFSRANDFGFSKHPDETLKIWNKDEVLADVVWAIRKWQPDVIVNRFDHNSAGKTHGHHTSSAILSYEAFEQSPGGGIKHLGVFELHVDLLAALTGRKHQLPRCTTGCEACERSSR